jgi:hypothetical protein
VAAVVLSKRALVLAGVFAQDLRKPSIKLLDLDNPDPVQPDLTTAPPRDVLMTEKEDDWREPFLAFLLNQRDPEDKAERERITQRSANYVVIGNDLYRKAASTGVLMSASCDQKVYSSWLRFIKESVAAMQPPPIWSARHTYLACTGPRPCLTLKTS